ncbi:YdeI/OmpD-associated family protein [Paenibacillus pini]|uniref:Periplasmic membrane protein n=1 Tax=Paenibacillus pini JCM 16418 TaxID=1236976 RepID=W7YT47_9BACL|nr:YdeI/OmpD-associated family protein [Paenibacillus pini]GAF10368.1 hypothetical protein JCM16418_4555 [Paenibacillus pini JCM 16418]
MGDYPIIRFEDQLSWEKWLDINHQVSSVVRLQLAKKNSGLITLSYAEALDSALCYGWIDSRKEAYDDQLWIQRFGPRGPNSIWSVVNKEKVELLIRNGRMKPSGLKEIERAKQDGRWDAAYEPQSRAAVPEDLEQEFKRVPAAKEFFDTLDSQNRYAILFRIQTAKKPETRTKRIHQFVDMLVRQEKIYPGNKKT